MLHKIVFLILNTIMSAGVSAQTRRSPGADWRVARKPQQSRQIMTVDSNECPEIQVEKYAVSGAGASLGGGGSWSNTY